MSTPNNIPPSSHGIDGWRKRRDRRAADRLAREAAVAARTAAALEVRKAREAYRQAKANGTLPNPTAYKAIDDVGGYDINGNPL